LQEELQTWNGGCGNAAGPGFSMVVKSDQGCVAAARPPDEAARRLALLGLNILDTPAEARFDQIIYLAKLIFGVPIAYIAFVDEERQWIKARIGTIAQENHRDISFCGHAILSDQIMIVPDASQDYRFATNPLVLGEPFVRFYAGQPLKSPDGFRVGTICIVDRVPREISDQQIKIMRQLGRMAEREFAIRDKSQLQVDILMAKQQLEKSDLELKRAIDDLSTEKQNSEALLRNIFPGGVADELRHHGRVKAVAHDQVSVLFSDFCGFTAVAASYSASELVEELNRCFCFFDSLCSRHGVEKLKTIGDGYMCVGRMSGDPVKAGLDLLCFAREILAFVHARKRELEAIGRRYWDIRIGIHSGPVVAGVVGTKRMAYDIWGNTVNVAARIEQTSETGRINMSRDFRDLVGERVAVEPRGILSVRNSDPVEMFFFQELLESPQTSPGHDRI
jgi:adenylate cyclase